MMLYGGVLHSELDFDGINGMTQGRFITDHRRRRREAGRRHLPGASRRKRVPRVQPREPNANGTCVRETPGALWAGARARYG